MPAAGGTALQNVLCIIAPADQKGTKMRPKRPKAAARLPRGLIVQSVTLGGCSLMKVPPTLLFLPKGNCFPFLLDFINAAYGGCLYVWYSWCILWKVGCGYIHACNFFNIAAFCRAFVSLHTPLYLVNYIPVCILLRPFVNISNLVGIFLRLENRGVTCMGFHCVLFLGLKMK